MRRQRVGVCCRSLVADSEVVSHLPSGEQQGNTIRKSEGRLSYASSRLILKKHELKHSCSVAFSSQLTKHQTTDPPPLPGGS